MFRFAKHETVVEDEVDNHDNGRRKHKSSGSEYELIREGEVNSGRDVVSEFVKRNEETKKLGK